MIAAGRHSTRASGSPSAGLAGHRCGKPVVPRLCLESSAARVYAWFETITTVAPSAARDNSNQMRRCFAILGLLPTLFAADEHWVKFTGAPFEVFSNTGPR